MSEQRPTVPPTIRRDVELDVGPEETWELVADGERWSEWLAPLVEVRVEPGAGGRLVDDGGVARRVAVDDVVPGRSVHFRWWPEDGRGGASSVELVVEARPGGSRLRVTEVLAAAPPAGSPISVSASMSASASAGAGVGGGWAVALDRARRWAAATPVAVRG